MSNEFSGLVIKNVENTTLSNVHAENCEFSSFLFQYGSSGSYGSEHSPCKNVVMKNCSASSSGTYGIALWEVARFNAEDVTVVGCSYKHLENDSQGVMVRAMAGTKLNRFSNCTITNNPGGPIKLWGTGDGVITFDKCVIDSSATTTKFVYVDYPATFNECDFNLGNQGMNLVRETKITGGRVNFADRFIMNRGSDLRVDSVQINFPNTWITTNNLNGIGNKDVRFTNNDCFVPYSYTPGDANHIVMDLWHAKQVCGNTWTMTGTNQEAPSYMWRIKHNPNIVPIELNGEIEIITS